MVVFKEKIPLAMMGSFWMPFGVQQVQLRMHASTRRQAIRTYSCSCAYTGIQVLQVFICCQPFQLGRLGCSRETLHYVVRICTGTP